MQRVRIQGLAAAGVTVAALSLAACSSSGSSSGSGASSSPSSGSSSAAAKLSGTVNASGSTFQTTFQQTAIQGPSPSASCQCDFRFDPGEGNFFQLAPADLTINPEVSPNAG